ncbi:hypothetical protein SAMN02983003_3364 [Devosia enhydra]|uniref:PepSY domain-containing protein n=1 Tax=Devosia enhydra TaxID=665118 RepID=A0A1K2I1D3_9HYPH|nr:hypothetical protein [Devosia enhydra]SFZ86189.1 hypothetical protein SAMN02983003_3364 [Devosia enhydra]
MRALKIALVSGVIALAAGPALAQVPFCTDNRPTFSNRPSLGFSSVDPIQEKAQTDQMRLRRIGVEAISVDYWNGCIRAWVRQPGGGQAEEFYDPNSLRRVG